MAARVAWTSAVAAAVAVVVAGGRLGAQGLEIAPFGGYRFGGDFFELLAAQPLDRDGAVTLGVAVNVTIVETSQLEAVFTRERAEWLVPVTPSYSATAVIEHWLVGGLQELQPGRVRPFLTGLVGLTRYATEGDSEIRFAVSAGGGVKLFPTSAIGIRLDGRAFTTIIDAGGSAYACAPGRTCFLAIHADVVWQAEFTTGIIVKFK
jgi:hypothetical protein